MNQQLTRRAVGGLALGAVSAGAVGAQSSGSNCSRSEEWGNWEVTANFSTYDGSRYYGVDLRHKASGIAFDFRTDQDGNLGGADVSVTGFGTIYNDVDWFLDDLIDNGGRSLEVTMVDPNSGFRWEVRGRALPKVGPEGGMYGSVALEISEADARQLYRYMSSFETQVEAEAKLILDDGSRHVASTWKMTTNGAGVLDDRAPRMMREVLGSVQPGECESACFVTTACCAEFGRPDDGVELTTLRGFRDNWLIRQPGGAEDIALYYRLAPRICAAIAAHPRGRWELARVYATGILPCVALIKLGLFRAARHLYQRQIMRLQVRYEVPLQ